MSYSLDQQTIPKRINKAFIRECNTFRLPVNEGYGVYSETIEDHINNIIKEQMYRIFPQPLSYNAFGFMDYHGMLDDSYCETLNVVVDKNDQLFVSNVAWRDNVKATGSLVINYQYNNAWKWSLLIWQDPVKVRRIAAYQIYGSVTTKCGVEYPVFYTDSVSDDFYMYIFRGFRKEMAMFFPHFTLTVVISVEASLEPEILNQSDLPEDGTAIDDAGPNTIGDDLVATPDDPQIGSGTDISAPSSDVLIRATFNPLYPQQGYRIFNLKTQSYEWTTFYAENSSSGFIDGQTLRNLGYDAPDAFYILEFRPNGKEIVAHPET